MSRLKGSLARLRAVLRPDAADRRMEEEFAFHIEMESRRLKAEGVAPEDARRQALLRFGGLDRHREEMRDGRGARIVFDTLADVRYAARVVRRSPGAAVAIALTLGIGIGLSGFTYGFVDSILFRAVPARAPEQLVGIFPRDNRTGQIGNFAYTDYEDIRDQSGAFADVAGMLGVPLNVMMPGSSVGDMVWGEMVTENFFSVLDIQPALGRFFTATDAPRGANAFAVLSHASWRDRFGADPGVIGRRIRVNGAEFAVIGVAPKGFKGLRTFGYWPELWVPVGMHTTIVPRTPGLLTGRGRGWVRAVGRMHERWDIDRTAAAADVFAHQLAQQFPDSNRDRGIVLVPARSGFENPQIFKPHVLVMSSALGIVGTILVLVVICANLANLQLSRAATRSREFAIRLSLGCSRLRLTKQMLVETAVVAAPGFALAAVIISASPLIESVLLPKLPFRVGMDILPNARIALFTTLISAIVVFVLGVSPALRVTRATLAPSLANVVSLRRFGRRRVGVRGLLVVSQLAISFVLLVGGALFTRSFFLARGGEMGFDATDRLVVSVNVGLQGYEDARGKRFYDEVLERVRAQSGVVSATWAFPVPFDTQDRSIALYVDGASNTGRGPIRADASIVGDDLVNALGLRLVAGRGIEAADSANAPAVIVVSRALAARLSSTGTAVGGRVRLHNAKGPLATIVGVVDDATFQSVGETNAGRAYLPLRQHYADWQTLVVHTRDPATSAIPRLRGIVAAVDPLLPVFAVGTLDGAVANGWSSWRTGALAAAVFGALAMLIAAIGLYAVVASSVSDRRREIGLRVALGSTPQQVMRFVMIQGLRLGAWGLALGLAGALLAARLMARLLFGISAFDAVTFIAVPLGLFIVVVAATYLPARRALKLEPMTALRID